MKYNFYLLCVTFLSISAFADQQVIQSDWLLPEVGSHGNTLNATVEDVQLKPSGAAIIDIALPEDEYGDFSDIQIISRNKGSVINQIAPSQWVDVDDDGKRELRIFLKRHPKMGFQLRLIDAENDSKGRE